MRHRPTRCTQSKESLDTFSVDVGDGGVLERVAVAVIEIGLLENGEVSPLPEKAHLEVGILRNKRDG